MIKVSGYKLQDWSSIPGRGRSRDFRFASQFKQILRSSLRYIVTGA